VEILSRMIIPHPNEILAIPFLNGKMGKTGKCDYSIPLVV